MELVFPFKNLSTHFLLDFLENRKVKDFILLKKGKYKEEYPFGENYFEIGINQFKNTLPNFENEILQIINTTNQETIDSYFNALYDNVIHIHDKFSLDYVRHSIADWNKEDLRNFEEEVEKESEKYFENEDRKRSHLEEYETWDFGYNFGFLYGSKEATKKVKRINYNFYCVEKQPDLIDESYCEEFHKFLSDLAKEYLEIAEKYGIPYSEGSIKSKVEQTVYVKPIVFVEGEHDITYIKKAAELLSHNELLNKIEIRQRGGCNNLDKIWEIYKDNNWETIPQKKLLLYDCDVKKQDEEIGLVFRRIIKTIPENKISKGIENLFPNSLIDRAIEEKPAFVDYKSIRRVTRGESTEETTYIVNMHEKKNLCEWICKNGSAADFSHFKTIFDIIATLI